MSAAAEQIGTQTTSADASVDPDTAVRMVDAFKDVSNETLQNLWASLLAREVLAPTSISARTIDVVKNLAPNEARLFQRYVGRIGEERFVLLPSLQLADDQRMPVLEDLEHLTDAGLFSATSGGMSDKNLESHWLTGGGFVCMCLAESGAVKLPFGTNIWVRSLTNAAVEIAQSMRASIVFDEAYWTARFSELSKEGWDCRRLTVGEVDRLVNEGLSKRTIFDRAVRWPE